MFDAGLNIVRINMSHYNNPEDVKKIVYNIRLLSKKHDKLIFGPDSFSSQLETSKLFARYLMEKYNILF